jgi:hypothetical protein
MVLKDFQKTFGDDFYREVGVFTITLHYKLNTGEGDAVNKAEQIKQHFKRGTTLLENGTQVIIKRTPAIGSGYDFNDRWCIPIRIEYFSNQC